MYIMYAHGVMVYLCMTWCLLMDDLQDVINLVDEDSDMPNAPSASAEPAAAEARAEGPAESAVAGTAGQPCSTPLHASASRSSSGHVHGSSPVSPDNASAMQAPPAVGTASRTHSMHARSCAAGADADVHASPDVGTTTPAAGAHANGTSTSPPATATPNTGAVGIETAAAAAAALPDAAQLPGFIAGLQAQAQAVVDALGKEELLPPPLRLVHALAARPQQRLEPAPTPAEVR